eukprot:jgi/Antlo1/619/947
MGVAATSVHDANVFRVDRLRTASSEQQAVIALGLTLDVKKVGDTTGKIGAHDKGAVAFQCVQAQLIKRISGTKRHRATSQVQGAHLAVTGQLPKRCIAHVQAGDIFQLAGKAGIVLQAQMRGAAILDNHIAVQTTVIDIHIGGRAIVHFQQRAVTTGQGRTIAYVDVDRRNTTRPAFYKNRGTRATFDMRVVQHQLAGFSAVQQVRHEYTVLATDQCTLAGGYECAAVQSNASTVGTGAFNPGILVEMQLAVTLRKRTGSSAFDDTAEHFSNLTLKRTGTLKRLQAKIGMADQGAASDGCGAVIQAYGAKRRVARLHMCTSEADSRALRSADIIHTAAGVHDQRRIIDPDTLCSGAIKGQFGLMIQLPVFGRFTGVNGLLFANQMIGLGSPLNRCKHKQGHGRDFHNRAQGLELKVGGYVHGRSLSGVEPMKTVWLVPKEWSLTCTAQRVRIKHPKLCRNYLIKASEPAAVRAGGNTCAKQKRGAALPYSFQA